MTESTDHLLPLICNTLDINKIEYDIILKCGYTFESYCIPMRHNSTSGFGQASELSVIIMMESGIHEPSMTYTRTNTIKIDVTDKVLTMIRSFRNVQS